ncbi:MAG: hypothetical protein GIX03_01230 [Candidatus Eremiobacteraeota bacterium]|nr:hypothetical protein [Candidatus Eremiobacteraeota bacterium]
MRRFGRHPDMRDKVFLMTKVCTHGRNAEVGSISSARSAAIWPRCP